MLDWQSRNAGFRGEAVSPRELAKIGSPKALFAVVKRWGSEWRFSVPTGRSLALRHKIRDDRHADAFELFMFISASIDAPRLIFLLINRPGCSLPEWTMSSIAP